MFRHVVGLAVTLFVLGFSATVAEGSGRPTRIVNPYEAEHFSCKGRPDGRLHNNPDERLGYNGFRIATDLNFDGREDLILSMSADTADGSGGCANAGCAVTVFLMRIDKSYRSVDFFLHPLAVGSRKGTANSKPAIQASAASWLRMAAVAVPARMPLEPAAGPATTTMTAHRSTFVWSRSASPSRAA
jgi:hypothetical protein